MNGLDRVELFPPAGIGKVGEGFAKTLGPLPFDFAKVEILLIDAPADVDPQPVALVAEQIDRKTDGDVASYRGVEGKKGALGPFVQSTAPGDEAIENRFSVFTPPGPRYLLSLSLGKSSRLGSRRVTQHG